MSNTDNTTKDWRNETGEVARRVAGMVRRVAIRMTSSVFWQTVGHILLDGETETLDAEVFSGIGFYARPAAGANAEAIVAFPGGSSNPSIVATRDEALRKRVCGGANQDETFVFNSQVVLQFSNSGLIQAFLIGGPTPVKLALQSDVDGVITAYNGHTHPDPQGGVTGVVASFDRAPPSVGSSVLRG